MTAEASSALAHVTSPDNTVIAYRRVGRGTPLVVVPGGLSTSARWIPVAQRLADRHEVFVIDRRGRGGSDPGSEPHSLAREVDDAHAVLSIAGRGAALLGHSYGGLVALELARQAEPGEISRLLLYEPGGPDVRACLGTDVARRLAEIAESGDADALLKAAMTELAAVGAITPAESDATIALYPSPEWDSLAEVAWTLPREIMSATEVDASYHRYASIELPTLVILGRLSLPPHRLTCERLAAVLPNGRLALLDGQGHVAHQADPDQLASLIADHLA